MSDPVFLFDFASPNAYFSHRVLPEIERRTRTRFRYQPVLLGGLFKLTGNQAPMITNANVPAKLAYDHLEITRFIARHKLDQFQMNPHFPVNTLGLMRGAVAAEVEGVGAAYVEAMFHYMWEEPRALADPAIFAATLTDAGLPAEQLLARSQDQAIKDQLAANTQAAADAGAYGIPSFIVGGELYFGKNSLAEVEEAIATH